MTKAAAKRLVAALEANFGGDVEAVQIRPGRYRFNVVSPRFDKMPHLKRQDEAWKVVDEVLDKTDALDITLVLTYSPRDIAAV